MIKKIFILFYLFIIIFYLVPDTTDDETNIPSVDKYKEILTYGIEEEVTGILKNLGNSPGKEIYTLLSERYKEALLPDTKIELIRYFINCNNLPDNIITLLYEDRKT